MKVRVRGLNTTNTALIEDEVRSIEAQRDVAGVLEKLVDAKDRWAGMDCFRDISFEGFSPSADSANQVFADIRFVEGDKMTLGIFTEANKVAPEIRFNKNNLFGRGYSIFMDMQPSKSVGVVIPTEAAGATLFSPFRSLLQNAFPSLNTLLERGAGYCLSTTSLFKVGLKSAKPAYGNFTEYSIGRTKEGHTRNKYSDEWVMDTQATVGFGSVVRQTVSLFSRQRSLKNSETNKVKNTELNGFHYDATVDQRQYRAAQPSAGWAAWLSLQCAGKYAGLPSSSPSAADLFKFEARSHHITPITHNVSLHLQTKFGTISTPTGGVHMNDRFFVEVCLFLKIIFPILKKSHYSGVHPRVSTLIQPSFQKSKHT